jgi:hypothetical protein
VGDTPTARALLGANLQRLMQLAINREEGLTREELACRMLPDCEPDSAWSTVRSYIAGSRWPRPERLDTIAAVLEVRVSDLLEW